MDFSFAPGDTSDCADVIIADDTILEAQEQFTTTLQGNIDRVTLDPDLATVTIGDNDGKNSAQTTHSW